mmetsp:Transcript_11904/g.41127  ORF Transcript_11904/g.41127 Transcript_11904/m.41127 type:complete len:311 (-) Transcript_11904:28-960(-)
MCGVSTRLSMAYMGESGSGGSGSWTSSAAPAKRRWSKAATRAASSMSAPRAVLMRYADGRSSARRRASSRCRVPAQSGACTETKSLDRRRSSICSTVAPGGARPPRDETITRIPKARASSATRVPTAPEPPMRPIVLPPSSKWGMDPMLASASRKCSRSPAQIRRCCATREEEKLRTCVRTSVATASVLYAGQLQTSICLELAASTSMLLKPVPASTMSRTLASKAKIVSRPSASSLVMTTSQPRTRSRIWCGGVESWRTTCAADRSALRSRRWSKFSRCALSATTRRFAILAPFQTARKARANGGDFCG